MTKKTSQVWFVTAIAVTTTVMCSLSAMADEERTVFTDNGVQWFPGPTTSNPGRLGTLDMTVGQFDSTSWTWSDSANGFHMLNGTASINELQNKFKSVLVSYRMLPEFGPADVNFTLSTLWNEEFFDGFIQFDSDLNGGNPVGVNLTSAGNAQIELLNNDGEWNTYRFPLGSNLNVQALLDAGVDPDQQLRLSMIGVLSDNGDNTPIHLDDVILSCQVPEPTSIVLAGLCLSGLVVVSVRRR